MRTAQYAVKTAWLVFLDEGDGAAITLAYGIEVHARLVENVLLYLTERREVPWKNSTRVFRLGLVYTDVTRRQALNPPAPGETARR